MIRLFPNIPGIKSTGKRRAVMVLVGPLVLVEYVINGAIAFFRDFHFCWKLDHEA